MEDTQVNIRAASVLMPDFQALEESQPVDLSMQLHGIVPTLQNMVSTVNLDCKLNLQSIALQAPNAEYNPERFPAVIMRLEEPKTTAFIFASGKMVCTVAENEERSELTARKCVWILQYLLLPVRFKDFKIQNILELEGLAYAHGPSSSLVRICSGRIQGKML